MRILWLGLSLALGAACAHVSAAPYWVVWEGNDYPENEGWERIFGDENGPQQGGSNRSIDDGWLVLDSRRNHLIYDSYFWRQQLNPALGELFVCEWTLTVLEDLGVLPDSGLAIARDGRGTLAFQFGFDYLRSSREQWIEPIEPGVPHTYRVESYNMLEYQLYIDGVFARVGTWDLNSLNESYVGYGDSAFGGGRMSLAQWDYLRFGVIPEPQSLVLVGCVLIMSALRRIS